MVRRQIKAAENAVQLISREILHRFLWEFACCGRGREGPLCWPNFLYLCDESSVSAIVLFMKLLLIRKQTDFIFIASIYNSSSMHSLELFMSMSVPCLPLVSRLGNSAARSESARAHSKPLRPTCHAETYTTQRPQSNTNYNYYQ
jgi:hypothetical protein